jgi:hypothetical protein
VRRHPIPDIPSSFAALDKVTYYPLLLMKEDPGARRQFLKHHVDALRMKREGLQMQFKANMEAATSLAALATAQSSSSEGVSERIALLLVARHEADRQLQEARARVESVLRSVDAGAMVSRLPDKMDEAASIASAARDEFLRGTGAPPASPAGAAESAERRAWLDDSLERYIAQQTRYHRLAAMDAVARQRGIAAPS